LKRQSALEREILDYLAANPEARDTLRGIIEWWLLKQKIVETSSDVEAAVVSLVAKGKLRAHVGVDGQVSYGLSYEHQEPNNRNDSFHSDN
jgi:hypothetical protein